MPNYRIVPEADFIADPNDDSNATYAYGISDPGDVTGLTNGTACIAQEFVLSPASAAFTPTGGGGGGGGFATLAESADAYLTGPVLPAATTALTFELDAALPDFGLSGAQEVIEYISTTFQIRLDARGTKKNLDVTVEASNGAKVFTNEATPDGVYGTGRMSLVVSFTFNRGDGNSELKIFVDGTEVHAATAATPANPQFVTNRALELMRSNIGGDLYAIRIWTGYTANGVTSGLGAPLHEVTGAAANWNAPGTGLAKAGAASFT